MNELNSEELQAKYRNLRKELLLSLEKELEEIKAEFKEDMEKMLVEKKEKFIKSISNQTSQDNVTQTQSHHIVNGKIITNQEMANVSDIDGKSLSEQIIKDVWDQIAKAQNNSDDH